MRYFDGREYNLWDAKIGRFPRVAALNASPNLSISKFEVESHVASRYLCLLEKYSYITSTFMRHDLNRGYIDFSA